MSLLPSLSKSPISAMVQPDTLPSPAVCTTWVPFNNQMARLPLPSRQTRSDLPSPLKSPIPAMVHEVETVATVPFDATCVPFMNQIATVPLLVLRQRMSRLTSPLKSPVPTTDH